MDEVGKIIDEIKQVVFLKLAVALPDWEEESDFPPHWSSALSYMEDPLFWEYEDLIFSDSDVYDIMERVAGKYGWKRWKPANEDEAMLYACMHYYDSLSGVNPLTGVFVKDGKYVLFYEKFCVPANLNALIFNEQDFKGLLEDHRKYLEEDIREGRAVYLACGLNR